MRSKSYPHFYIFVLFQYNLIYQEISFQMTRYASSIYCFSQMYYAMFFSDFPENQKTFERIYIGILGFTPFPDIPEFYASHKLMNVKNHHIYSSKFILNVLDLTQIDITTEEDKAYRIGYWARLFKAQTWEDIKMVAEKDENLCEASESLYMLNTDDITRQKCRARQEQLIREEKMKRKINTLTSENATLTYENETLTQEIVTLKKLLEANNISY